MHRHIGPPGRIMDPESLARQDAWRYIATTVTIVMKWPVSLKANVEVAT